MTSRTLTVLPLFGGEGWGEIEPIIRRFVAQTPQRFEVAKERVLLQGALIDIDDDTGKALSIQRISEPLL